MNRLEIRAERNIFRGGIEVVVFHRQTSGQLAVAEPLTMRTIEEDECIREPTAVLHPEDAQSLMDELWRCGLRPSEGTGSAGSLAATERHLKDMQAIAKGLLKKDGIEV